MVWNYLALKTINPKAVTIMITGYRQEMVERVNETLQNDAYTYFYGLLDLAEVLGLVNDSRRGNIRPADWREERDG